MSSSLGVGLFWLAASRDSVHRRRAVLKENIVGSSLQRILQQEVQRVEKDNKQSDPEGVICDQIEGIKAGRCVQHAILLPVEKRSESCSVV
jgi:hypothetical protein